MDGQILWFGLLLSNNISILKYSLPFHIFILYVWAHRKIHLVKDYFILGPFKMKIKLHFYFRQNVVLMHCVSPFINL